MSQHRTGNSALALATRWTRVWLWPLLLVMATTATAQETQQAAAPASAAPFEVQAVRECSWLTQWVLGRGMCKGSFYVPLPGEAIAGTATPEVQLTGPAGTEVDSRAVTAKGTGDGRLLLQVAHGSLPPGAYAGKVKYGDAAPRASVPILLKVRAAALWPLILIIAGVVLGQLLKYMNDRGNAIADARKRLDRLRARLQRLRPDLQAAAASAVAETDMYIDQGDVEAATAAFAKLEKTAEQLEKLAVLSRHPDADLHDKLIDQIIGMIGIGSADAAETKIEELRTLLGSGPAVRGAIGEEGVQTERQADPIAATAGDRRRATLADLWGRFIAYFARPLIYVILLIVLVLVGLNALYVSGSATLGANPLTDGLALFAWGLAADVASRTLTNFRGTAS